MRVFISWSGPVSRRVATLFGEWLPGVIQECSDPFISTDVGKGEPWFQTITTNLKDNEVGVVLITKDNMDSSWLNFEAGALLNKFEKSGVRPLLVGLKKEDYKGPMSNLQLTEIDDKDDMLLLVKSLNERCSRTLPDKILEKAFESSWQELLDGANSEIAASPAPVAKTATRSQGDKIDEILNLIRGIASTSEQDFNHRGISIGGTHSRMSNIRRDKFISRYGSINAYHTGDSMTGEVMDYREDEEDNLVSVLVKTSEGRRKVWRDKEFEIFPF